MVENDLIKTGMAGLDAILLNGIPRANMILVQGATGTGKTLMGMEFIYRGITEHNENGMIVVFETRPDKLVRDAAQFGWDFAELERQHKLKIVFTSPQVLESELRSPDSLLLEIAAEIGARRIFIDGIGLLRPLSPVGTNLPTNGPGSYRELLQQLLEGMHRENLTTMFSHELGALPDSLATLEVASFLADTVIELSSNRLERNGHRSLEIIKSRGQNYVTGRHTLQINGGKGLEVFRRVQASVLPIEEPTSSAKRSLIGVSALDDLIGGGIFDGSTTMVVGISGVGKTVLATQLLLEGAKGGKRGLLISLDEHPSQIIRNAGTLGLDLKAQMEAGMIHIFYESPQELEVDAHFARIIRKIEQYDIQRLVIDGVTSYSTALEDRRAYRDFFHALVAYSKFHLMTTFFNYENPEVFGISSYMPEFPVNSIVDNIILLSLVELGSSLHRCIAVVKARGCKHKFDTREFTIGEGGISLIPLDEQAALLALPIESYSSVLSRAPTRISAHLANKATPAKGEQSRMELDHDVVIPKGFPLKLKKKPSS
jgi:circadian clock protein KaiC